jgi:hypothetical protein
MPYLKHERRVDLLASGLNDLDSRIARHGLAAGDLNYIICTLAQSAKDRAVYESKYGYEFLRNLLGEIHEAEQEIRRRLLVPYEVKKRHENGDVFDSE